MRRLLLCLVCALVGCSNNDATLIGTWLGTGPEKASGTWIFRSDGTYENKVVTAKHTFLTTGRFRRANVELKVCVDSFQATPDHAFESSWHQMKGEFVDMPFRWVDKDTFAPDDDDGPWTYKRVSK